MAPIKWNYFAEIKLIQENKINKILITFDYQGIEG